MIRNGWSPAPRGGAFLPQVRLGALGQPSYLGATPGAKTQLRYTLGQTAQEWYNRARAAVAQFDLLLKKVDSVDNKTERENIAAWLGTAENTNSPMYRYVTVKSDLAQDVAREGVGAYNKEQRQGRVEKLEEFNKDFEQKVDEALSIHGVRLPGDTRIETRTVESPLTTPILIGAGLVAAGLVAVAVL